MPTNTFPDIGELTDENSSVVADSKKFYRATAKEIAFEARYGKKVSIVATMEKYDSGGPKECTLRIQSAKDNKYVLIEYLTEEGLVDYAVLAYTRGPNNIETRFTRHLDAEVTLADLIAEE